MNDKKREKSRDKGRKIGIWVLAVLVLAVSLINASISNAQTPFLYFPLSGYTPYNVPISSVFDHSVYGQTVDSIPRSAEYKYEGIVIAYTGERGSGSAAYLECYQQQNGYIFRLHGNYQGVSGIKSKLCYDGHPGYDYIVGTGTDVYAAASGQVIEAGTDSTNAKYVKIKHSVGNDEFHTLYYHLDSIDYTKARYECNGWCYHYWKIWMYGNMYGSTSSFPS